MIQRAIAVAVCATEATQDERCLRKIIDFFGIERRILTPEQASSERGAVEVGKSPYSVLMSAECLAAILRFCSSPTPPPLLARATSLFVFGFDGSTQSQELLRSLTGLPDIRVDVRSPAARRVCVTSGAPGHYGVLSGVVAECAKENDQRSFEGFGVDGARGIVSVEDRAVLLECEWNGVPVFVSAPGISLDIDQPVDGAYFDVRRWFSSVVPPALFLKRAFRDAAWVNHSRGAAFIVDDPALKRRYGFLDFDRVLASMNDHDFCTTIAFIPWNWNRTNRRTAAVFLNNPKKYSLVVHGCDHTSHEFGTSSLPELNHRIKAARQRSEAHLRATGIRVAPIMVFPQGVFSAEAAYALKCNNFVAAVNTEVNPVGDRAPSTPVRELWQAAMTHYSGFPIFTRRYMSHGLENFAFDSFLGKPCLLVAHHEVFKNEGRELTAFVDRLNSLTGGLEWSSLENVIAGSYYSRRDGDERVEVRMFGNRMVFVNQGDGTKTLAIGKREPDSGAIARVKAGSDSVRWSSDRGLMSFLVSVPAGRTISIDVEYKDSLGESSNREGTKYKLAVRARRHLSELRDDYVCRSEVLNTYAGKMMRLLRS